MFVVCVSAAARAFGRVSYVVQCSVGPLCLPTGTCQGSGGGIFLLSIFSLSGRAVSVRRARLVVALVVALVFRARFSGSPAKAPPAGEFFSSSWEAAGSQRFTRGLLREQS